METPFKPGDRVIYTPRPETRCHPKMPGARGFISTLVRLGDYSPEGVPFVYLGNGLGNACSSFTCAEVDARDLAPIQPWYVGGKRRVIWHADRPLPAPFVSLRTRPDPLGLFSLVVKVWSPDALREDCIRGDRPLPYGVPWIRQLGSGPRGLTVYDFLAHEDEWDELKLELACRKVLEVAGYSMNHIEVEVVPEDEPAAESK